MHYSFKSDCILLTSSSINFQIISSSHKMAALNLNIFGAKTECGTSSYSKCISVDAYGILSGSSTERALSPPRMHQTTVHRKYGTVKQMPIRTLSSPERKYGNTGERPMKFEQHTCCRKPLRRSVYLDELTNESAEELEQATYEEARRRRYIEAITTFLHSFDTQRMLHRYRAIDIVSLPLTALSTRRGRFSILVFKCKGKD